MQEFFLGENLVLAGNATKILLPGRILAGIPGESFFLGGIPVSTDFSARFLPRYAAGIFPGSIPPGKRATSAGSRRDPGAYFTRAISKLKNLHWEVFSVVY